MITSVEIEGLRGIKEGKLVGLTPLVVLVGPNGSGKSTILDALYLGASGHPMPVLEEVTERRRNVKDGLHWLVWRAQDMASAFVTIIGEDGDGQKTQIKAADTSRLETSTIKSGYFPQMKLVDGSMASFRTPLHTLYTQMVQQGRRLEANEILRTLIPNLDHLEILTEGNEPILHIVYSDHSVPVALAGDGIQALLRLSLELAVSPGGTVLLEEPEVHQHPAAIRQSARAIQAAVRRGVQVILTTHSLELIDALLTEAETDADIEKMSVYRLRLDDGILKSSCAAGKDVAAARVEIGDDLR